MVSFTIELYRFKGKELVDIFRLKEIMSDVRDFPCLYYLSEYGGEKELNKQMALLMYMHGLDFADMENKAKFLNIVSDGRVKTFLTADIAEKMVKEYQNNDPNKIPACEKIQRLRIFHSFNLKSNCCYVCPYSTNYVNDKIDQERALLRYIIEHFGTDTTWLTCTSALFTSVISVGRCNDIVRFPFVSFYGIVMEQLKSYFMLNMKEVSYNQLKNDLFIALQGILYKDYKVTNIDDEQILKFIDAEVELLRRVPLVTKNDYVAIKRQLMKREPYIPLKVARAVPEKPLPSDVVIGGGASSEGNVQNSGPEKKRDSEGRQRRRKQKEEMFGWNDELQSPDQSVWSDNGFIYDDSSAEQTAEGQTAEGNDLRISGTGSFDNGLTDDGQGEAVEPFFEIETGLVPLGEERPSEVIPSEDNGLEVIECIADMPEPLMDGGENEQAAAEPSVSDEPVSEDAPLPCDLALQEYSTGTRDNSASDEKPGTDVEDATTDIDTVKENTEVFEDVSDSPDETAGEMSSDTNDSFEVEGVATLSSSDGIVPREEIDDIDYDLIDEGILSELDNFIKNETDEEYIVNLGDEYYRSKHDYEAPCRDVYTKIPYISDRFERFIIRPSDVSVGTYDFVRDVSQAYMIPIEYVRIGNDYGFLVFAYKRFYFLDIKSTSDKLFSVMHAEAKGIRLISLNPVWVYAGMRRLGIPYRTVASIALLYKDAYGLKNVPSPERIFDMVIEDAPLQKDTIRRIDKDTLWLVMPRYEEVFLRIVSDELIKANKPYAKYEWAISKSCDLSLFLVGTGKSQVKGGNALTAEIMLTRNDLLHSVRTEGVLIGVTARIGREPLKDKEFWIQVSGSLAMMDSTKMYAYMVGISDAGLSYFVCDFFDQFYDCMLSTVRHEKEIYEAKQALKEQAKSAKAELEAEASEADNSGEEKDNEPKAPVTDSRRMAAGQDNNLLVNIQMCRFSFSGPVKNS